MFIYNILSFLFAWMIPDRNKKIGFREYCKNKSSRKSILKAQEKYKIIINKLSGTINTRKISVLFLINEISKWKAQSLYDLMLSSKDFEPIIGITLADRQNKLNKAERETVLNSIEEYFKTKNMKTITLWDKIKDKSLALNKFNFDIIFYQQPWGISDNQKPQNVNALTCYIPYFVPNYGILSMDCKLFHKYLFRYYVLNNEWEKLYKSYVGKEFGSNIYPVGHTMLDAFYHNRDELNDKNYVIYAPHWSITHPKNKNDENYSTFDKYGKIILNYAKLHPEINWVFKPHPTLKAVLKSTQIMSPDEIEKYYNEWETIGFASYSGDYSNIFLQSKAMITDCGSFLVEYFCTKKPVIHLISETCKTVPPKPTQRILDSYYQVHNKQDLFNYLDDIIINNKDIKKQQRLDLLEELHLLDNCAAENILYDLRKALKGV